MSRKGKSFSLKTRASSLRGVVGQVHRFSLGLHLAQTPRAERGRGGDDPAGLRIFSGYGARGIAGAGGSFAWQAGLVLAGRC